MELVALWVEPEIRSGRGRGQREEEFQNGAGLEAGSELAQFC